MVTEKAAAHFHGCQIATSLSVKQHKLKRLIAYLSDKEGKGLEFISLYIPHEIPIDDVASMLRKESDSVAQSERHRDVRDHVQDTIKNIIQHLKLQKEIPENGIAIFAGTFANNDSVKGVLNIEEIVPPEPINSYLYRLDNHFLMQPLREMLRELKVVGLISLDSKSAGFGVLNGERFEFLENITSGISGKSAKGGSSQRRYERARDMELTNYFHRVADHAAKAFLENHKVNVLLVGGPGTTKEDFLSGDFLHYELKNVFLGKVDTQSVGRDGVKEVLDKSSESLKVMCLPEQKSIIQRLLSDIAMQNGLATYGLDSVLTALKKGEVEVALVTDNTEMIELVAMCKKCELQKVEIMNKAKKIQTVQLMTSSPCERCRSVDYEVEEKDVIDVLEDEASKTNARVEVISLDSEEKAKLTALGGFTALLRYRQK